MTSPPAARSAALMRLTLGHDLARGRNLGGLPFGHEPVLQIEHDMRGTRRIDVVENVQRLAALQNTVDGGLGQGDLVHAALLVVARMMTYRRDEERGLRRLYPNPHRSGGRGCRTAPPARDG